MTEHGRSRRHLDPVPDQELRDDNDLSHVLAMWDDDEASRQMGMEALVIEVDHAVVRMRVAEHMVNGHRTMHGGFIFTLADSTFGLVCNTRGVPTVAAAADIVFIAPAHLGEVLVAEGRQRLVFGRSGITDVTVTREEDATVIAEFRGRSRVLPAGGLPKHMY
jgi:acyl-CoA thioesterase